MRKKIYFFEIHEKKILLLDVGGRARSAHWLKLAARPIVCSCGAPGLRWWQSKKVLYEPRRPTLNSPKVARSLWCPYGPGLYMVVICVSFPDRQDGSFFSPFINFWLFIPSDKTRFIARVTVFFFSSYNVLSLNINTQCSCSILVLFC